MFLLLVLDPISSHGQITLALLIQRKGLWQEMNTSGSYSGIQMAKIWASGY
jgi:hypothetical protein